MLAEQRVLLTAAEDLVEVSPVTQKGLDLFHRRIELGVTPEGPSKGDGLGVATDLFPP
jgi:hypothetical protein